MSNDTKIPFELNLLLKQQNVKEMENRLEIKYEGVSVKKFRHLLSRSESPADERTSLALTLSQWQIDENASYLQTKSSWEQYGLFRKNLECLFHYFDCIKLTAKASRELAGAVINSGIGESNIAAFEEIEDDNLEQNVLELVHDDEMKAFWSDLEASKKDYDIATKNFKILLEIIDFSWEELDKLKKQYDDVFTKYQHARSQVERELPAQLEKMKEIFYDCLQALQSNIEELRKSTNNTDYLVKSAIECFVLDNKTEN